MWILLGPDNEQYVAEEKAHALGREGMVCTGAMRSPAGGLLFELVVDQERMFEHRFDHRRPRAAAGIFGILRHPYVSQRRLGTEVSQIFETCMQRTSIIT